MIKLKKIHLGYTNSVNHLPNKILLGKIDFSKEMKSQQKETINLIENLIEYSMLRDEFRIIKKRIRRPPPRSKTRSFEFPNFFFAL